MIQLNGPVVNHLGEGRLTQTKDIHPVIIHEVLHLSNRV